MKHIRFENDTLYLLDQTRLPDTHIEHAITDWQQACDAIVNMIIRGAPLIGITAAYGIVLGALAHKERSSTDFVKQMDEIFDAFSKTRPTAVNLFGAIQHMRGIVQSHATHDPHHVTSLMRQAADDMMADDEKTCQQIGAHGAGLFDSCSTILTHCNAGALATAGYGTALGVVRALHELGKLKTVYACETRPYLQGARLTAYELAEDDIPVVLITDGMAGFFMRNKTIDAVVTGADRIAKNGDTANKIGTYSLAVLAKAHRLPFYIAAPQTTFDGECETGDDIEIEYRSEKEVTHFRGLRIAPRGVLAKNPAFDITPADLITGIVTQKGVLKPPYTESIRHFLAE